MHQMTVDVDKTGSIWLFVDQMVVPDLVVEGTRFHDSIAWFSLKGKTAARKRPALPGAIKVPLVPP